MKRIRKIATDFAKDMGIDTLPITMNKLYEIANLNNWTILTYSKGYTFIKSENLEKYYYTSKGFTYLSDNYTFIFIKDELAYLDKINVICHEMGHLVLQHIGYGNNQCSNSNESSNVQEQEADIFALEFQAPAYLMDMLKVNSTNELINRGIFIKENAVKRYKLYINDNIKLKKSIFICT